MLVTPALAFVLGVVAAWLVALIAVLLWWADRRRLLRGVVAFSLRGLARSLEELGADLPAEGSLAQQARGCRELCAALLKLVEE